MLCCLGYPSAWEGRAILYPKGSLRPPCNLPLKAPKLPGWLKIEKLTGQTHVYECSLDIFVIHLKNASNGVVQLDDQALLQGFVSEFVSRPMCLAQDCNCFSRRNAVFSWRMLYAEVTKAGAFRIAGPRWLPKSAAFFHISCFVEQIRTQDCVLSCTIHTLTISRITTHCTIYLPDHNLSSHRFRFTKLLLCNYAMHAHLLCFWCLIFHSTSLLLAVVAVVARGDGVVVDAVLAV